jgi:hypothetical protein
VKSRVVALPDLLAVDRWRVEIFTDVRIAGRSKCWPAVQMAEVVTESTEAVSPEDLIAEDVLYVGLENVEPVTGHAITLGPRPVASVKSRSKVFRQGQVLYGRLRPYLRKVFLASPPYVAGICSTEFLVLDVHPSKAIPEFVRALLASREVAEQLARFQIGAALPRVSAKDFLTLKVPLPPLGVQQEWLATHHRAEKAYLAAKKQVDAFPGKIDEELEKLLSRSRA